jgi:hypothetical protein
MQVTEHARHIQTSVSQAVDTVVAEIRRTAHNVCEKVKEVAIRVFNSIVPPAKRRELRDKFQVLGTKTFEFVNSVAISTKEKTTHAFHSIFNIASSCLDTLIPSRREALENAHRLSAEADAQKARAVRAEGEISINATLVEHSAQRIHELEQHIETLSNERSHIVESLPDRQPSPIPPTGLEGDEDRIEDLPHPQAIPEVEIEGTGEKVREEDPSPESRSHAKKRKSHPIRLHGAPAPSLKTCLQGTGYPKRKRV